jgi:ribosome-associated translation inhibitor RaiA
MNTRGRVIRLPGELYQVLTDRLDRLVREVAQTPHCFRDVEPEKQDYVVEVRITLRQRAAKAKDAAA